jgi:hypothetical protein
MRSALPRGTIPTGSGCCASDSSFNLTFRPLGAAPTSFAVAGKDGLQFAAELDVLAALIRARVIRARGDGEENSQ